MYNECPCCAQNIYEDDYYEEECNVPQQTFPQSNYDDLPQGNFSPLIYSEKILQLLKKEDETPSHLLDMLIYGVGIEGINIRDVYLDDKYDFENREEICKSAKHEIIHCLIGELYLLAIDREMTYKEIYRIEETLVHKLEKLLC